MIRRSGISWEYSMRILFCIFLIAAFPSFGQGTIKVAKPGKDSVYSVRDMVMCAFPGNSRGCKGLGVVARVNYAFRNNSHIGADGGIVFRGCHYNIGLELADIREVYQLSKNSARFTNLEAGWKVNTQLFRLSLPLMYQIAVDGRGGDGILMLGLAPEYLFKVKSDEDLFRLKDFHKWNCGIIVDGGRHMPRLESTIGVRYTHDLFANLLDEGIYNSDNSKIGWQRSSCSVISFYYHHRF